ncbi:MAG TPA: hypothetical protein VEK56_15150 [Vicinamibacterales bacterium]|nr:hypothetical protein [Vicinamibacterales bacterium]
MASPVVFLRNVALGHADTGGQTSTVGEPSLSTLNQQVFFTGNWYASKSANNANTWQFVDPYSTLPPVDGGFCCDQTVIGVPSSNLTIWLLQYVEQSSTNTLRLAAHRGPGLDNAGWVFWDLRPVDIDPGWANQWFDYNHASTSNGFLYVGSNIFEVGTNAWVRSVVFRFPLSGFDLGATLTYEYFETDENFSLRCAHGATDTMHIVSHNTLSQVRVYSWPESAPDVTAIDVDIAAWLEGHYNAAGPDGRNWLSRCDGRITGVWVSRGELGIMWSANRQPPQRPLPYIRVVRINESTNAVIDEPDIWSGSVAYAYPDACPNGNGEVGVTLFRGGGSSHPGHVVGFWDASASAWRLRVTRNGTNGPNDNKWGDYLTCRRHAPRQETWVAAGFTLQGGGARQNIEPRYVHFGRRVDVT